MPATLFAGGRRKRFPKLAAALAARGGTRVLLTSGPSEREAANRIAEAAGSRLTSGLRDRVLTLGDFSLAELRALLDRVVLHIGGDSGPLHIAATSGVPIVGLLRSDTSCTLGAMAGSAIDHRVGGGHRPRMQALRSAHLHAR